MEIAPGIHNVLVEDAAAPGITNTYMLIGSDGAAFVDTGWAREGEAEARLVALACSKPPEGYARWSIRLLAERVVEMEIVETAHFNTVGRALKKTRSNRI